MMLARSQICYNKSALVIRYIKVRSMVFNATFNNTSVIWWQSVLLVEETGVPVENHRPVASHPTNCINLQRTKISMIFVLFKYNYSNYHKIKTIVYTLVDLIYLR
jgi:hypothetical protein